MTSLSQEALYSSPQAQAWGLCLSPGRTSGHLLLAGVIELVHGSCDSRAAAHVAGHHHPHTGGRRSRHMA
jgi:hypothetical protein